jgi:oligosaccharide repeat unit polymerase
MASCLCLCVDSPIFYYILLGCGGFYLGVVTNGKLKRNIDHPIQKKNLLLLEIYTLGVFSLYILANIILYKDASIPLFSENATENKIAIFSSGSGWIRRIFFFSSFIPIGLLLLGILSIKRKKQIFYGGLLLMYMLFSILLGSKSGFLGIFYIIWLFYTQENLWGERNMAIRRFIKSKIKYLLLGSVAIFSFIVFKENEASPEHLLFSIGFRLMEFGDVMLYYKIPFIREYFDSYNFLDFIKSELNGILGILRITPYKEPLGFIMSKVYSGDKASAIITGPNTVFLVRGHIFFGYVGGILYCFVAGWLFSYLRKKILMMRIDNIFFYAVSVFIFFNLEGLLREFHQYLSVLFDFGIYTISIFLISLLINDYILQIRKSRLVN